MGGISFKRFALYFILAFLSSALADVYADTCGCNCEVMGTAPAAYQFSVEPNRCDSDAEMAKACQLAEPEAFSLCVKAEGANRCQPQGCFTF